MNDEKKNISIKNWAEEDRPREKLLSQGIETLSDSELIAILIGSGSKNESAVELSKRILNSAGNNLNSLGKYSVNELKKFKGIGEARAISIVAALELGKRRTKSDVILRESINCSSDAAIIFQQMLCDLPYEEFWILMLNRANKIIDKKRISSGGVSGTVSDPKIILKAAIDKLASGIIVCHNHPSGNINPSRADTELTKKLKQACSLVDISFIDHLIVSEKTYYSFADEGVI